MGPRIAGVCMAAALLSSGCAHEDTTRLPDDFLGRWKFDGSSGGLTGEGDSSAAPHDIVLTEENELETWNGNARVSTARFEVSRGESIYSTEVAWFITLEDTREQFVVDSADDWLRLSDNAYDGYGTSYRRWTPAE